MASLRVIACCGGMVIVAGLERMTFEVLRVLRERGASVHCIVNSWENDRIVPLAQAIGATWSIGAYQATLDRHTLSPLKWARMATDILATSAGLIRDVWRFRPTHVFVPEFGSVLRNAPALALLRLIGIRVVLRLGNPPDRGPFYRRLWRWGVGPLVDRFVCNSKFTLAELCATGVSRAKCSYIYNTIPARTSQADGAEIREEGRIVYVGQVIPEKGLDLLLDAVGLLAQRGRALSLDVAGAMNGWVAPRYLGYREALLERARRQDLAGCVRFLGWREDIPSVLRGAAVHCCPSRGLEGFGLVVLEAKQVGIPSVVFPVGALPELVNHGVDGWVCSEVSASALADGLDYFLSCRTCREAAGRLARTSLQRFSRERFAAAWWEAFSGRMRA